MDDLVAAAMKKWPNVPACFGWLGLDAKGDWYMRDDAAQLAGRFGDHAAPPTAKGSRLQHNGLIAFIGRNYLCDDRGRWYFQNGPQQVFVELELTPWILQFDPERRVVTHTGQPFTVEQAWTDENGRVYLSHQRHIGAVRSQDMGLFVEEWERHHWPMSETNLAALEQQFAYVRHPNK
ncbi:MAG: hypothetical protein RL357_858 [Pseudomonadota bacterium]|jgi:hypothetical protein